MSSLPLRGFRIAVEERSILIRDVEATSRDEAMAIAGFLVREGCEGFLPQGTERELIRVRKLKSEVGQ